jgi:hypothetical protein
MPLSLGMAEGLPGPHVVSVVRDDRIHDSFAQIQLLRRWAALNADRPPRVSTRENMLVMSYLSRGLHFLQINP